MLEKRLKSAEKTIQDLKSQYSDMQVTLATFAGIRHEMEIFKKKSEKAVESTKRLQVKVNKSEALESVAISKNALRSASTTDILVNNENFNVAQFIRTEFANSPSFAATCRNVEDFCVAGVKLFVDKPQHKILPWTYAMGGKSRNNAFIQLPTKFIEDIWYTALVGTGFSENMADWSPDEDDVYKGACTRVGLKVQSSLGKRRPSKSAETPTPKKKFKSIIIDSGDEDEAVAE